MFGFKFKFGYAASSGTVAYNPLINYDWSTTTTSGLRYLKDVGSTPTYNASMYFGRGAYLNGVDQTITVSINTTIQTALKRVNGVVTISETSQALTNYVISGVGVHKDYYLFTRLLTTAEKDSYTNTPELFYAMAQTDSSCVLNMPMCETDGYARNMKSYSETSVGSDFNNNLLAPFYTYFGDATASVLDGKAIVTASLLYGNLRTNLSNSKKYYIKIVVSEVDSLDWYLFNNKNTQIPIIGVGSYSSIISESDIVMVQKRSNVGVSTTIKLDSFEVIELSGIHSITNYTSSVRDNAKNLQYGLQTCKFVRDSLGVIQSASDYLVCDGVGYGNTGWKPSADESFYLHLNLDFVYKGTVSVIGIRDTSTASTSLGFYCSGTTSIQLIFGSISFLYIVDTTTLKNYDFRFEFNKDDYTYRIFDGATLLSNGTITLTNFNYSFILGARNFNGAINTPSSYKINNFEVYKKLLTNEEIQAL